MQYFLALATLLATIPVTLGCMEATKDQYVRSLDVPVANAAVLLAAGLIVCMDGNTIGWALAMTAFVWAFALFALICGYRIVKPSYPTFATNPRDYRYYGKRYES